MRIAFWSFICSGLILLSLVLFGCGSVVDETATTTTTSTTTTTLTWVAQTSGTSSRLNDVSFVDASNGWIAGLSNGIILEYNGTSWSSQDSSTGLSGVDFVSTTHGWLVGNGYVHKTTDGGAAWTNMGRQEVSGIGYVRKIDFINENVGWAIGDQMGGGAAVIFSSTDGGTTWSSQEVPTTQGLGDLSFVDATHGWAVGNNGTILA